MGVEIGVSEDNMGQADHAPCVVCSHHKASIPCLTCSTVNYCSTTCQVKDSNNDHHACLPYTILHENRCGRLLMASRDISAGEVLFNDIPGAVGPDNNPKPWKLIDMLMDHLQDQNQESKRKTVVINFIHK